MKLNVKFPYWRNLYSKIIITIVMILLSLSLCHNLLQIIPIFILSIIYLIETNNKKPYINGDDLIYSIIHDLRMPISIIKCLLVKEKIDKIKINNSLNKLENMLDAVSEFYRINRINLKFEFININNIVLPIIQENNKYDKILVLCDKFPTIKCDKILITRVFENLISNAYKYRSEKPLNIIIKYYNMKKYWKFEIIDNGIGINEEEKDKIFNMFYRSKNNPKETYGEGIGLSIVKKIIKLHNGEISCYKNEYNGATFYFTISKKL